MEFMWSDMNVVIRQLKRQDDNVKLKRRSLVRYDKQVRKKYKEPSAELIEDSHRPLPETFIREDDVFYETVKTLVERGFGGGSCVRKHLSVKESMRLPDIATNQRFFLSLLDDMSNTGLYRLAKMLTGGDLMKLAKVPRWKLKKITRERLSIMLKTRNSEHLNNISKQISELGMDPNNFHNSCIAHFRPASQSFCAAATEVLDALNEFPSPALMAMQRKLKGIQGYMPQLCPPNSGWKRSDAVAQVGRSCKRMLPKVRKGDKPKKQLAQAMTVAGLTMKLLLGRSTIIEFQQFSPEIEALQGEISKAIWLLKKADNLVLKNLLQLLDPNRELVDVNNVRVGISHLLTEYLFECGEMNTIPECLFEALAIINRSSRSVPLRFLSKKDVEEEVECVLTISAQIKQVVWDSLIYENEDFDKDYVDAYMEEGLEETDDDSGDDEVEQEERIQECLYSNDQIEGTGETNPADDDSTIISNSSSNWESKMFGGSMRNEPTKIDAEKHPPELVLSKHSTSENNYLSLQEACDETSMVAYRLIGSLLDEFARVEGYTLDPADVSYLRSNNSTSKVFPGVKDEELLLRTCVKDDEGISYEGDDLRGAITIQVLEELIPSFPTSAKEKVKELMRA